MTIEVFQGFYKEKLVIKKPIKLISNVRKKSNNNQDAIIISDQGSAIIIDIPSEERCQIQGISILCTGNDDNLIKRPGYERDLKLRHFGKGVGNPQLIDKLNPL